MNSISKSQLGGNARDAAPDNNASNATLGAEQKNDSGYSCPDRETLASPGQRADEDRLSVKDQSFVRHDSAAAPTNAAPRPEQQGTLHQTSDFGGHSIGSDGAARDYCKNGLLDLYRIQVIGAVRRFRQSHGTPVAPEILREALIADAALENYERKLREECR